MGSSPALAPVTPSQSTGLIGTFSTFNTAFVNAMKEVSVIADKGPSYVLYGCGVVLMIVAVFLRLAPFGLQVSKLQPSEFIALLIASVLLLIVGSSLRLYQYHVEQEINRSIRETGQKLLERGLTPNPGPPL